jgi:tRNA pseudouridine55 synthase
MTPRLADGLLLIDKPLGITSFDVIRQLRRQTGVKKIGHAGTLDPLATGLMLMLFGTYCKRAMELTKLDKRYDAVITLGETSTTGDGEGDKTPGSKRVPSRTELEAALLPLTGRITQTPSVYSAIKIDGQEAYKHARAGRVVEVPSRQVEVYGLAITDYDYPKVTLAAHVSSGTYIRSLAQDLGEQLGSGAYLSGLSRSSVGPYTLLEAHQLSDINPATLDNRLELNLKEC